MTLTYFHGERSLQPPFPSACHWELFDSSTHGDTGHRPADSMVVSPGRQGAVQRLCQAPHLEYGELLLGAKECDARGEQGMSSGDPPPVLGWLRERQTIALKAENRGSRGVRARGGSGKDRGVLGL